MKIPKYRVEWTPVGGSPQDINVLALRTNNGIEAIKDTFQLTFIDKNNEYDFDLNDRIKIYLYYVGEAETLVMDGLVQNVGNKSEEKNNKQTIKGANIFEVMLTFQAIGDSDAPTNPKCDEIIQNLLGQSQDIEPSGRQVTWNGSNPSLKSDGSTEFPDIEYFTQYKPLVEHLELLSSDEYTEDGSYIYYLDTGNTLVWKPRPQTITGSIDYGNQIITTTRDKNNDETVNFYIINCGKDISSIEGGKPEGATIHTYKINETSIGKHGSRYKYEIWNEISTERYKNGQDTGSNDDFRAGCQAEARLRADTKMNQASGGVNKLTINLQGTTAYVPGDKYEVSMPAAGWTTNNRQELRLMEIEHNFDKTGWWTTLSFTEDI